MLNGKSDAALFTNDVQHSSDQSSECNSPLNQQHDQRAKEPNDGDERVKFELTEDAPFCPICFCSYKNPVITRCNHTFCRDCILDVSSTLSFL